MYIIFIVLLSVIVLLLRCIIVELIGFIYAFIILAWADVLVAEHSQYGDIFVTRTKIGKRILLINDGVVHSIHNPVNTIPDGYCHVSSGIGQMLSNTTIVSDTARLALIGLGGGAILYYARPQQQWQAYEIDPIVINLAKNSDLFKFVANCAAPLHIYNSDGFAAVEQLLQQDVIMIDTFFGDHNVLSTAVFTSLVNQTQLSTIFILHVSGLSDAEIENMMNIGMKYGLISIVKEVPSNHSSIKKCSWHDFQHPFIIPSKWMLMSRNQLHIRAVD